MRRAWPVLLALVVGAALGAGGLYLLRGRGLLTALDDARARERRWAADRDSLLLHAQRVDAGFAESRLAVERARVEVTDLAERLRQAEAGAEQSRRDAKAARDQLGALAATLYDLGEFIGGLGEAFGDAANLARKSQDEIRRVLYAMVQLQNGERRGAQESRK